MIVQTPSLAALRMYDMHEVVPAVNTLGEAILSRVPGAPASLTWGGDHRAQWLDPNLVLGQSCGWPLVRDLAGRVRLVGAFTYHDLPTADGAAQYRSVLVARDARPLESLAELRVVVNSYDSLSGWISLAVALSPSSSERPPIAEVVETGSHVASLAAVRCRLADLAAIDGVTFALVRDHRPHALDGLQVVGHGPPIPTLPLITALDIDVEVVRDAVRDAIADPATADARRSLHIERFVPVELDHYRGVAALADRANQARAAGSDALVEGFMW